MTIYTNRLYVLKSVFFNKAKRKRRNRASIQDASLPNLHHILFYFRICYRMIEVVIVKKG